MANFFRLFKREVKVHGNKAWIKQEVDASQAPIHPIAPKHGAKSNHFDVNISRWFGKKIKQENKK